MYHSITFGNGTLNSKGEFAGTNTWSDWHLIPSSRPLAVSPPASSHLVTTPGRNGTVDQSEYLVNRIYYGNRSGSWEFIVDNDHESWVSIHDKIVDFLHGKRMKCVLEDDPNYYYEGRFSVADWNSGETNSTVTINYIVGPYRYHINPTGDWLWDPFNFETDRTDQAAERRM